MKRSLLFAGLLFLLPVAYVIAAQGQNTIGYQGRLANAAGQPINATVSITFALYDVAANGTALWSETQPAVQVQNGIFSVRLGDVTPLQSNLFNRPDLWLGVKVGTDPEMTPRSRLASVAYAFNAQRVGGKRVLMGGPVTLPVAVGQNFGSATITFSPAFVSPPAVTVSGLSAMIDGKSFVATEVSNLTALGCTVTYRSLNLAPAATAGSATFTWIAVGE